MRAWNSWMAEISKRSEGRLQYAALVPIRSPHLAVQEMQYAKDKLNASSVMILPSAGERHLHDHLFDPFWSEAQNLQMPVSIHIGWPNPRETYEATTPSSIFLGTFELSVWWGYLSVFTGGILDRFPNLKLAFIEHDCRWFKLFMQRATHWYPTSAASPWPAKKPPMAYLKEHQIYFTYEGDYSFMPEFMELVGEDRVMGALDFPHTHYGTASLSISFDLLKENKQLTDAQKRRVLRENALDYYGFQYDV
jgi:predicted TIM-barrel fold metal-dependent hydrolase